MKKVNAFGSPKNLRQFNLASARVGFNGKENDNEVKGNGNSVDFGSRIYDSRLGRWLSLDPLQSKYPYFSPYSFAANNPIYIVDADGKRIWVYYNEGGKEKRFLYKPGMTAESAPEVAKQTVIALNTIHAVDKLAVNPTGFDSAEPSPKEVITALVKSKTYDLKIHALTKSEWEATEKIKGNTPANFLGSEKKEGDIYFSPEIGFLEIDANDKPTGLSRSPTSILSHEVKHGYNDMKKIATELKGIKDPNFKDKSEKSAVEMENRVALNKENPEGDRTSYGGGKNTIQKEVNKHDSKTPATK